MMASRKGSPNIRTQVQKEVEAVNDYLEQCGSKCLYYAVPLPDTVQPTILLPKGAVMTAYSLVMVDEALKPHSICPTIHPADLLYRLVEIKHTLHRHLVPKDGAND